MNAHDIIGWLWLIFLIYWIINARKVKPVAEHQDRAIRWRYSRFIVIGLVLFLIEVPPLGMAILPHSWILERLGVGLAGAGLALAIWARRTLAGNWSGRVTFKENHELIQHGPYRFVRHPIYAALLLMFAGTVLVSGHLGTLLGSLAMVTGFCIKLRQEEVMMLKHFPEDYAAYKKRVKALIPLVV